MCHQIFSTKMENYICSVCRRRFGLDCTQLDIGVYDPALCFLSVCFSWLGPNSKIVRTLLWLEQSICQSDLSGTPQAKGVTTFIAKNEIVVHCYRHVICLTGQFHKVYNTNILRLSHTNGLQKIAGLQNIREHDG